METVEVQNFEQLLEAVVNLDASLEFLTVGVWLGVGLMLALILTRSLKL